MMKSIILAMFISAIVCGNLLREANHQEFITSINLEADTWIAGENKRFENMNILQVQKLLGTFLQTPEDKKLPVKNVEILEDLPENFDLREAWPQCESLRELRDQSGCGSCWAFGAAEAMSDRICIASNGKLQTRISTDTILSCCSSCGFGCNGGYPSAAWDYWKRNGVPTGGLYGDKNTCRPYQFPPCDHHVEGKYGPCAGKEYDTPNCEKKCQDGYSTSFKDDLWFASSAYSVANNEKAIMTEIYQHGSVEVAFQVYEDFINYKSGVYKHTKGSYLGGHAVKMIGWGVENGTKYWIIVNSWNEGWGDNGTFKILRGSNHLGIEGGVVATAGEWIAGVTAARVGV